MAKKKKNNNQDSWTEDQYEELFDDLYEYEDKEDEEDNSDDDDIDLFIDLLEDDELPF